MWKYVTALFLLLWGVSGVQSQNILDAYRYTFQTPTGTARTNGLGGAMSAIGADLGMISQNPAGIAAFWKSEVAGSLGVAVMSNNSVLRDGGTGKVSSSDFQFNVPQGGIVFTTYSPNKDWMSKSFGITYNRQTGYGNEIFYEGRTLGSISERWAALGTGLNPDDLDFLEAGPAFDAGVIYDIDGDYLYEYDYFTNEDKKLYRSQLMDYKGNQGELSISFGGNYMNTFLIGGSIGIDFLNFESQKSYLESDNEDQVPGFEQLEFNEYLTTSGVGINAKIGTILKFTPDFSWSLALASPTALKLQDNFRNTIRNTWTKNGSHTAEGDSKESQFEYSFVNPWKISTGVGYRISNRGFVDAEVDYVGYTSSKFKFKDASVSDQSYQNQLNREISESFKNSLNVRLGGEMALSSFRVRAGVFMYGSPLETYENTNGFSLGFGYRGNNWYLDVSYMNRGNSYNYAPYELLEAVVPDINIKSRESNIGFTIGFKM